MRSLAVLAVLPLLACSPTSEPQAASGAAPSLVCTGSGALSANVVFETSQTATLFVQGAAPGTIMSLPQAPTGSGFLYTDGNAELRGQGSEAMLSIGGESLTCRAA